MKSILGVSSVGSGLALAAAPRPVARLFGLPRRSLLARALGMRDIAIGVRLLERDPRSGLAARAVSDLLDLGLILRERRHRSESMWAVPRLLAAVLSAGVAAGLRLSAVSKRRAGLLSAPAQLVRRRPGVALGVAFALGVTAARIARRPLRPAQPAQAVPVRDAAAGASRQEVPAQTTGAEASVVHEAPDTIGVGSPIADAPTASGLRY